MNREKYETSARIVLGSALLEQGRAMDAARSSGWPPRRPTASVILRRDGVHPRHWPVRWTPSAMTPAQPMRQDAVESLTSFVADMSSEHAAWVLASREVREIVPHSADVGANRYGSARCE